MAGNNVCMPNSRDIDKAKWLVIHRKSLRIKRKLSCLIRGELWSSSSAIPVNFIAVRAKNDEIYTSKIKKKTFIAFILFKVKQIFVDRIWHKCFRLISQRKLIRGAISSWFWES